MSTEDVKYHMSNGKKRTSLPSGIRHSAFGVNALDRFLPAITGTALKKRGFGEFKILTEWDKVVGAHLAHYSTPTKMVFERGKTTDGALHVQVTSAMALDFQHLQPMILERIATYFGYRAVGRLVLMQTHSAMRAEKKPAKLKTTKIPQSEIAQHRLSQEIAACADDDLKASLLSLANTVFNMQPKP